MVKYAIVIVCILLSLSYFASNNNIINIKQELRCKNYAIITNKNVVWMSGYRVCFNLDTGKALNSFDFYNIFWYMENKDD